MLTGKWPKLSASYGRVETGELINGYWLDLVCMTGLTKSGDASNANLFHCFPRRLKVVAWVEFLGRLGKHLAYGSCDCQTIVGVDIHFANAVLDAALDFFDGNSPGLLELAAKLIDDVLQLLRNATTSVHH